MSPIPAFEIGVWNAWLFMIIYPLQWLLVVILPQRISERTSHAPDIVRGRADRLMAWLTQIFWVGATLYSIFLPLQTGTAWLYAGLAFFALGLVALVTATLNVAGTPAGLPFSSGIYRFSRHPMYLSMLLVYLGVSIAAASWLFFLVTVITFFLQRHQARREEASCLERFGEAYRDYRQKTPRWLGPPGKAAG